MCLLKRIYYEEVHYEGQPSGFEERFEMDGCKDSVSISDEEIESYVLHLEEQLALARELLDKRERRAIQAQEFFKEIDLESQETK